MDGRISGLCWQISRQGDDVKALANRGEVLVHLLRGCLAGKMADTGETTSLFVSATVT